VVILDNVNFSASMLKEGLCYCMLLMGPKLKLAIGPIARSILKEPWLPKLEMLLASRASYFSEVAVQIASGVCLPKNQGTHGVVPKFQAERRDLAPENHELDASFQFRHYAESSAARLHSTFQLHPPIPSLSFASLSRSLMS